MEQIKINTPPRTTYTPKNLRTQYIMSFQGRDNSNTMVYWSNTFTDYDTKVMESVLEGNDYYIYDNTGKAFKTGEHVDLVPIQSEINTNKQNIEINRQNIQTNAQNIQANTNQIQSLNQKVSKQGQSIKNLSNQVQSMQEEMRSGLATITALTSLHPNPRSTAPVELSVGMGMYKDQCAGAAGLFLHPSDNFMIQGGVAFGNSDDWAGYVGVTFNFPWFKRK